jgi:hypothetical protein
MKNVKVRKNNIFPLIPLDVVHFVMLTICRSPDSVAYAKTDDQLHTLHKETLRVPKASMRQIVQNADRTTQQPISPRQ